MTVTTRAMAVGGLGWALLAFTLAGPAGAQQERRGVSQPPRVPAPARAPAGRLAEPQFPKTYDRHDAARDAFQRGDRQRRQAIDRQLQLVDDMAWYPQPPGYYRYRPHVATIYAYGWQGAVPRAVRRSYWYQNYVSPYLPRVAFEPWPLVPGRVYGYPYVDRAQQPLGHKVIRTGPNSYIYRPVYESDLVKKPTPTPAPGQPEPARPVPEPILTPPALNGPHPEPIPAPPPESGPREF